MDPEKFMGEMEAAKAKQSELRAREVQAILMDICKSVSPDPDRLKYLEANPPMFTICESLVANVILELRLLRSTALPSQEVITATPPPSCSETHPVKGRCILEEGHEGPHSTGWDRFV